MDIKKLSRILLVTGGFIELVIAILHFIWPFNLLQLPVFNEVSNSIKDFLLIMSLALSLCMIIFAFFSFYFSKKIMHGENSALFFCISQAILWIVRLILEFLIPVKMPLYFIENPSGIIIIGATFIVIIYLIPVFLFRRKVITI